MDFSLDIVHILILLGTTLRNFPPIASRAEKVLWVAAVARWICARLKVGRSSPVSPPRHGTIRAETAAWQPVRFQFKEREWDHTPPFTLQVFAYRTSHLLQHFLFTWCPHDQAQKSLLSPHSPPARLSAPDAQSRKVLRWSLSTANSWKSNSSFALLSFLFLPCIRTQLSWIRLVYTWDK